MKIDVLWRNILVKWMNKDALNSVPDVNDRNRRSCHCGTKGTGADVVGLDLSANAKCRELIKLKINPDQKYQCKRRWQKIFL